ncbi:MAG: carbohydrate binding domain-containing protein [Thermodesulfobacteriota bacterium]
MQKSLMHVILFAGLLILVAPGLSFGDNLIRNGGFEKAASDGTPKGWQINIERNADADIALDDAEKHGGKHACKVNIAPPGGRVTLSPDKNTIKTPEPGRTYKLSFWIKSQNLDYNQFFVAPAVSVNFRPSRVRPAPTVDLMANMQGAEGWEELSMTVKAPEDARELRLNIVLTKGTVWLDDFSVTPQ